ncbi:MAG: hypothetical protein U1F53_15255 [Burkholderiaceae bacterium]
MLSDGTDGPAAMKVRPAPALTPRTTRGRALQPAGQAQAKPPISAKTSVVSAARSRRRPALLQRRRAAAGVDELRQEGRHERPGLGFSTLDSTPVANTRRSGSRAAVVNEIRLPAASALQPNRSK